MAAELGPRAMFVAGGTDLFPKLKRRQFDVDTLIGLDFVPRAIRNGSDECAVDAFVTLADAARNPHLTARFAGYAEAAGLVSSPPLRNAGTIGGNLCVDTRCNYYDMTYEWRKAAGFCIKKDGDICLVAPSSPRCWAVSPSHTPPIEAAAADDFLKGKARNPETIRETAEIASKPARPLDNGDLSHFWRKRMVRVVVEQAVQRASDQRAGLAG